MLNVVLLMVILITGMLLELHICENDCNENTKDLKILSVKNIITEEKVGK